MNAVTKQRLVGTIVLVSLAVILIPLLLDGEGVEPPPAAITTIAPAPLIDTTPLPEPLRPEIFADAEAIDFSSEFPAADPEAATPEDFSAPEQVTIVPPELESPPIADTVLPEPEPVPPAAPTPVPETAGTPEVAEAPEPTAPGNADVQVAINTPELDAQGLPSAWTVQMGMFSNKGNAEALLARLLLANYKAYTRPQGGGLTGVFVGPVLTRDDASRLQRAMQAEFGEGLVTRFSIDSSR